MARWVAVHTHGGKLDGKSIISPSVLAELHTPQMTTGQPSEKKEISPGVVCAGLGDRHLSRPPSRPPRRGDRRIHGRNLPVPRRRDGPGRPDQQGRVRHCPSSSPATRPTGCWASRRSTGSPRGSTGEPRASTPRRRPRRRKTTVRRPGTRPAHPLEEYAGDYEHPGYGPLTVELHDGQLVSTYNGIRATLDHWHYEVFNAPKADNDPALADLNLKLQFQTNLKGYVDAVAVPLEPSVKPIVFTKRPDKKLSDPEYLKRFEGRVRAGRPARDRPAPGPCPVLRAERRLADGTDPGPRR